MLFQIPKAIISSPPSTIDTLKKSIRHLEVKVDSLQKIVQTSEIGTGFFSEIISLQLGLFLFIVGLAGFFSWKWFINKIELAKKEATEKSEKIIIEHKEQYDNDISSIKSDMLEANYNITRSMFAVAKERKNDKTTFDWAFSTAYNLVLLDAEDINIESFKYWLDRSLEYLSKIEPGNTDLKKSVSSYDIEFKLLETVQDEGIKSLIGTIKEKLYHIAYTIPTPPENLLESEHASTPPPKPS